MAVQHRGSAIVAWLLAALMESTELAHYGMIIPNDPMISQQDGRSVQFEVPFSHPFERGGMILVEPVSFNVTHEGEITDLLGDLVGTEIMGQAGYTLDYQL